MPEPRHSDRHFKKTLRLIAVAVLVAGSAACFPERDTSGNFTPGDPLYERLTSSGDRIIVERNEAPSMKLRMRSQTTRVYDEEMIPAGRIRIVDDAVERQSVDAQQTDRVQRQHDAAVLRGAWRIEPAGDDGWDVFGDDGSPLALWRTDGDRWTMRTTADTGPRLTADSGGEPALVDATDGAEQLRMWGGEFGVLALFSLAIDDLSVADRAALAMYVDRQFDNGD